ncbi:kinase-like domain-containing protein, partial [Mycena galopus ATCC 62051]
ELLIWRQLCHPNILPFFGLSYLHSRLGLVLPWMENGTFGEHLRTESPGTDARISLILDIALGLEYLHRNRVVHGDLHPLNVLVMSSHRACISDFGLSSMGDARISGQALGSNLRDIAPYLPPEFLMGENPRRTHFGFEVDAGHCG